MSNYIVLVKQVPDVSQITDNAFDPRTGNLIRTRLPSVINELDAQALAFANHMKNLAGDAGGSIIAVTMGPPMAAEVLRYSLSRCADTAVLLTDRALGGADTWATANPLAYAIKKIVQEKFGGDQDYYIIAGMQSVDGDTAQVPAQVAAELNIPCIAYATGVERQNGSFVFRKIISGGSQMVRSRRLPCIITVAKYEYPLFASFQKTRRAAAAEPVVWGSSDIKAAAVGVSGSKTRVIRVFPPGKTNRLCRRINSAEELAKILKEKLAAGDKKLAESAAVKAYILPANRKSPFDRSYEGTEKEGEDFTVLAEKMAAMGITDPAQIDEKVKEQILADSKTGFHDKALEDMLAGLACSKPCYKGDVWVCAEHQQGRLHPAVFELLGKGRQLADSLNVRLGVVVAGDGVKAFAKELIEGGADDVYVIEHPLLAEFDPQSRYKAVADCTEKYKPQILLYAATPQGRALAPMISYHLGCGLTADCTGLEIRDSSRKGQIAILMQTRPALGGNVMATICTKDSHCQMATARPGVMQRLAADPGRRGKIIEHSVQLNSGDLSLEILSTELGTGSVHFDSNVIVSGGKGMQNRDAYDRLLGGLCSAIRRNFNVTVEKGATRTAVEQGFAERIYQVGQTGTAVGPRLYIAVGISGAIQHMIGVANAETIIAVNTDPHAPIFRQCDYYIVAGAEQTIPKLAEALEKSR